MSELTLEASAVSFFCRNEQSLLVRDLEPNTKYEFAIRLHIDQLSSPWSPVVYQNTFPDGRIFFKLSNFSINIVHINLVKADLKFLHILLLPMKPGASNSGYFNILKLLRAI